MKAKQHTALLTQHVLSLGRRLEAIHKELTLTQTQIGDLQDSMQAVQTKLGADNSKDPASVDYRLTTLEQSHAPKKGTK